ncbi:hypothetical protein QAD02_019429 [Eretmocerus hayati]|uniref:Uncharacterized protein n=1 Tax=Eretmocerus hayati TaxID=131215 RepID=A0ACC2PMQ8_9HYME|nr:hypothetical protein QAD02_019429 [Eretmocerus hayati]
MAQAYVDVCKSGVGTSTIPCEMDIGVEKSTDALPSENSSSVPECAVCLQPCIHPARLPCNHVFCYLCIKGVANQSKRCPMCRNEIPADFLERPQLLEVVEPPVQKEESTSVEEPGSEEWQWFYQGREGWWQYDERTSIELETAHKQGLRTYDILIAGFLYTIDFGQMLQHRRNDPSKKRRIKRDHSNIPKKGVAGLRLNNNQPAQEQEEQQQQQNVAREIRGAERPTSPASDNTGEGTSTPIPPSNTPQTPSGGNTSGDATPSTAARMDHQRSDSLHQVLEQMRSLILRDNLLSGNQQDLHESIDDGSFSDSLLPWLHQTSSNPAYSSDEEHT